ncbi:MAG TPA: type II toxin-antitoxin system VapC family toxin [Caldilineae bacterium]|jgi:predicted nucleic acid-binding protein|nr:type II toxin-antitoxin system VapC family toxin [Caldilineae bacterium]
MTVPFVDTDVIIRLLTRDDPEKQAAAAALFERVERGELILAAPDTVIADAVYVLSSPRLYNLPRDEVRAMLTTLIRLPGFQVRNRRAVLRALDLYATAHIDFGDALIVASMEQAGSRVIYSYDAHFDRIPEIQRVEP